MRGGSMGFDTFSIPPQVRVALDALRPEERAQVMQAIYELRDLSQEAKDRYQVKKLSPKDNVYIAQATSDYRLFLRVDESARVAEVVDVIRQETLEKYARELAQSG
jgi:mRNA-degrading endonuclease RelE of RelBE toxin-antitoxin system